MGVLQIIQSFDSKLVRLKEIAAEFDMGIEERFDSKLVRLKGVPAS